MSELLATIFMNPVDVPNTVWSFFWIVPIVVLIAVVYKATKLDDVLSWRYVKECAALAGTILGFMFLIAVGLYFFVAIVT